MTFPSKNVKIGIYLDQVSDEFYWFSKWLSNSTKWLLNYWSCGHVEHQMKESGHSQVPNSLQVDEFIVYI